MHFRRLQIPGMVLAMVCAASVLTLAAPETGLAQIAETSQAVPDVCAEQSCSPWALQPFEVFLTRAPQPVSAPQATSRRQPEEMVRVAPHVPAALLRRLLMEEGRGRTTELRVPAALLTTLSAEERMPVPQWSPDVCGPSCSLY